MTRSWSPWATSTGAPASRPGVVGTPASNGRVPYSTAVPAQRVGSASSRPPANAAPPLKPTRATGRPAGATPSSQVRNHPVVAARDSATGRPMPRFANQA